MVDGLDFLDFDLPSSKISRRSRENSLTMILSLMKNDSQIFETCHHTHGQFSSFERIFWARIDVRSESDSKSMVTD